MEMGLRKSPAIFQRLIELATPGMQAEELFIDMEDIFVYAANLEEHGKRMRRLLEKLD